MDRDVLIALARESGVWEIITRYTKVFAGKSADPEDLIWSDLEYFAALVAAHEREACAKVAEEWFTPNLGSEATAAIAAAIRSRSNGS